MSFTNIKMEVQVVNTSKNKLPEYKTSGSAALDIPADIEKSVYLNAGDSLIVPTGLFVAIPEGYVIKFAGRSGLAFNSDVEIHRGIIDSDYRGELKVKMYNCGDTDLLIEPGDRICQAYLQKVERIDWKEVAVLSSTERGTGGLGSTGVK